MLSHDPRAAMGSGRAALGGSEAGPGRGTAAVRVVISKTRKQLQKKRGAVCH